MKLTPLNTHYTLKPYARDLIKVDGIYHGMYMEESALIRLKDGYPVTVYMIGGTVMQPETSSMMIMVNEKK